MHGRKTAPIPLVRTATESDLLAVASLYEQLAPIPEHPIEAASDRRVAAFHAMLTEPALTVLVAEMADVVIGTACLLLMPSLTDRCSPTGFLENMVVDVRHRERGVGRLLVDEVVERARRGGCRRLRLLSHNDHAGDAHEFYRACGFRAEAEGFRRYL